MARTPKIADPEKTPNAGPARPQLVRKSPRLTAAGTTPAPVTGPTEAQIAARAHELFLERGSVHGFDREDWLAAEAELRASAGPAAAKKSARRRAAG